MQINNKKLIIEFFKDTKLSEKNDILTVPKAPKEFEEIFGKKAPYKLVFNLNKHNLVPGSEFITQGSYFLSSMKEYMDVYGQTSLIKLNILLPSTIINKMSIGNCSILKKQKKQDYAYLPEFTLFSNATALNERKQFLRSYLVKNKNILDLDLTKFKTLKSDSKEISELNILEQYNVAKTIFKSDLQENVQDIKLSLKEKLKTEIKRINEYYTNQIKEKDDEIDVCIKKINTLKSELKHTFYQRDADNLRRNIRDSGVRLEMLKKRDYKERLEEEKIFHLRDEINKHALIIENKLVNATIYYYPKIIFSLFLTPNKSPKTTPKIIEISYDSLFNEFNLKSLICESCKKKDKIKEINLCKNGLHLVCTNCLKKCNACKKPSKK
jgi:hypothetical protein